MKPKAATISFIETPNGYEIPVICFEYDYRQQNGTFRLTSRVIVSKLREKRLPLESKAAA